MDALAILERELRGIFGERLQSLVAYGLNAHGESSVADSHHATQDPVRTLAIVESLTEQDLRGCAARIATWHDNGLATPLLVPAPELDRSLDAFPLEFAAISANHKVIAGTDPFERAAVELDDVRRACEVQARSHLLHLREGFVEAAGNGNALALLIVDSARPLAALVKALARLDGNHEHDAAAAGRHAERILTLPGGVITDVIALRRAHEIPAAEAERLFPSYLAAMERLVEHVDRWQR
jgi:hypothetical protein